MDISLSYAGQFNSDNIYAFSIAKKALRAEVNYRIGSYCREMEKDIPSMLTSEKTTSNLKLILENLKERK